jgi:hypothetical protein
MTDLNNVIPADSPLYLLSANDLNDGGEIVGQAYDQSNGSTPAFLAKPSLKGGRAIPSQSQKRVTVILPESIRQALKRHLGTLRR